LDVYVIDEDPSDEDVEHFSGDTAFCPDCGAEVWDGAEVCPECGAYIADTISTRPPIQQWFRTKWFVLVIIALLIAMLMWIF
jgi:hypothetical protein